MDIVAVNAGTVTDLFVHEGASVKKDGTAAHRSLSKSKPGLVKPVKSIAQQLELQHGMLLKERQNLNVLSVEAQKGLQDKKRLLEQQLKSLADITNSRVQQMRLSADKVNKLKMMRGERRLCLKQSG